MTTPTLNGQILGQAHHATRAVLDRALARTGMTFQQSIALNAAGTDGTIDRARLLDLMTSTLKIDEAAVLATIAELIDAGLASALPGDKPRIEITAAGRAVRSQIHEAVAGITERLYSDIPTEDLAVAGRVLSLVTQRANAELAATG